MDFPTLTRILNSVERHVAGRSYSDSNQHPSSVRTHLPVSYYDGYDFGMRCAGHFEMGHSHEAIALLLAHTLRERDLLKNEKANVVEKLRHRTVTLYTLTSNLLDAADKLCDDMNEEDFESVAEECEPMFENFDLPPKMPLGYYLGFFDASGSVLKCIVDYLLQNPEEPSEMIQSVVPALCVGVISALRLIRDRKSRREEMQAKFEASQQ